MIYLILMLVCVNVVGTFVLVGIAASYDKPITSKRTRCVEGDAGFIRIPECMACEMEGVSLCDERGPFTYAHTCEKNPI